MAVIDAPPGSPTDLAADEPPRPAPPAATRAAPTRRRPSELTTEDVVTGLGCAASALSLTWVVFARLTDGVGWFGSAVVAYVVFLLLYTVVTTDRLGRLAGVDRVVTVAVTTGAVVLFIPLLWLIGYVVVKGLPNLRASFFVEDMGGVRATDPPTDGGGAHAIVGTLQQVALALVITVPLSITCAVFLSETRSRLRRPVRIVIDAMSGLPSVVAGLFVLATIVIPNEGRYAVFGHNGLMASLALSMVMIPTVTRTVDVVLRLVPDGLREAGLALGSSRARTVWSVVLPTARSGSTTAVVLGIARAVGETAPLLFTSFGYDLMNANPVDGPQESLPLFVYKNIKKPAEASIARGFVGAFVLMVLVLALFVIARTAGRDRTGRPSRVASLRSRLTRPRRTEAHAP